MWVIPSNFQTSLAYVPEYLGSTEDLRERAIGPTNVISYVEIEAFAVANMVAAMEAMALYGPQSEDSNNTNGKNRGQLNPAWVAQLMGTTSESIFFAHLVAQS